jgi:hypothetical protein
MSAKAERKKAQTKNNAEFAATFDALRAILAPYSKRHMRVVHDTPDYYYLETTFPVLQHTSVMFAAVRKGKGYVSYHLLPIYMNPRLQARVSAELSRRKQGKACFNFKQPDEKLFAELAELTQLASDEFRRLSVKA